MTILWLIAWWLSAMPTVEVLLTWNGWGIGLVVCLAVDLVASLGFGYSRTYFHGLDRTWTPGGGWSRDKSRHSDESGTKQRV